MSLNFPIKKLEKSDNFKFKNNKFNGKEFLDRTYYEELYIIKRKKRVCKIFY